MLSSVLLSNSESAVQARVLCTVLTLGLSQMFADRVSGSVYSSVKWVLDSARAGP